MTAMAIVACVFGKVMLDQRNKAIEAAENSLSTARKAVDALRSVADERDAEWEALIEALIWEESRGDAEAVGDGGDAVGVLQLHPGVIEDVRMAGYNYTLADRLDREKSIAIWRIWQGIFNPGRDIHYALKIQNPKASVAYHRRIIGRMNEIKSTFNHN
jgi:hypothetical protein